ncbi:Protein ApaG [BD1-7 clade bacterium]|uniref:Protein ApaG n=1 Tax=BD1-7 clade bacterium TaxID=2029982 RepID=A0A5S9QPP2_9GAMM|nr:Protein ApaG [BD1-7 clade bacterium]CAA0121405.1 Protein ApaG [BD1-7 clade bacterium]
MSEPQADIEIEVETQYLENESELDQSRYVFAYNIRITNHSPMPIKLVSRYWHITDADEKVQEVNGEGVVGQQPRLEEGQSFQYTSGVILDTPAGIMEGYYDFVSDLGDVIKAPIPPFTLANPASLH